MAKSELQFKRSKYALRGTYWYPLSHLERNGERVNSETLRDIVAGGMATAKAIQVEDPYKHNKFNDDFILDPESQAVIHKKTNISSAVDLTFVQPLVLIWARSRVQSSYVGSLTEVRPNAFIDNATIGNRAVVSSGVVVEGATLKNMVFLGPKVKITGATIGEGSVFEKSCKVARGAQIGIQAKVHRGTEIDTNVWADDRIDLGMHVRVREGVWIGEGAQISPYTVIGARARIGAEAIIGDYGVIEPSAWIAAEEVVPGRMELREALKELVGHSLRDL